MKIKLVGQTNFSDICDFLNWLQRPETVSFSCATPIALHICNPGMLLALKRHLPRGPMNLK